MQRAIICWFALVCASNAVAQQGVAAFGPLRLGALSPVRSGNPTAHPHKITPKSKFYVFVVERGIPPMCTFEDCGREGALLEKSGGWITKGDQSETTGLAGLDEDAVQNGTQSMIVVSDASEKIVGIYPNRRMKDLPGILRVHGFLPTPAPSQTPPLR